MLTLVAPDPSRYDDWKAAFDEFGATAKDGTGYRRDDLVDTSREAFEEYLSSRAKQAYLSIKPDDGLVHCTYFWVLDGAVDQADGAGRRGELVGFLALRHALTEFLFEAGGHIGYSVRPSARGRGIATGALSLGLDEAAKLGIDQVLVCCSIDNPASRAVIERCGGQFDGIRTHPAVPDASRRYWFGTPPWPSGPTAA